MPAGLKVIPPIFVSHGLPALALEASAGGELAQWGRDLPRPRGVLVVSAHWQAMTLSRGSTAPRPPLLHDDDACGFDVGDSEERAKLEAVR